MFGKNKKNKKVIKNEGVINQPVIHTMQDDLDINLENSPIEEVSQDSSIKTDSPFAGSAPEIKEPIKDDVPSKPELNSVSSQSKKDSPFSDDTPSSSAPLATNTETKIDMTPKQDISPKPEKPESPKSKIESAPVMPKSVDDLTTAVGKDETPIKKEENMIMGSGSVSKMMSESLEDNNKIEETPKNKGKMNVFVYAIIVLLIVSVGVAGYFVWDSKYIDVNNIITQGDSEQPNIFTEEPEIVVDGESDSEENNEEESDIIEFSDKVNFLTVTTAELSESGLKNAINKKFLEMNNFSGNLLEFILVDDDNNPITFSEFASTFGITLPAVTATQLTEDFSLYLYKNGMEEKIGIAIKATSENSLSVDLIKEESSLLKGMMPLFLGSVAEDELADKVFNDSTYASTEIRFTNLNNSSSVDYTIVNGYLLFATSKDSGRTIIDKILLEDSLESEEITNNTSMEDNVDVVDEVPAVEGAETSATSKEETKDIFEENSENEDMENGETIIEV